MIQTKIGAFAVIGFLLELCALASLGYLGFSQFALPLSVIAGIGLPLAAAVLWGLFRAPRRTFATPFWARIIVEAIVMGGAAAALAVSGHPLLAISFASAAIIAGIVNDRAEYAAEKKQETTL